MEFKELIFEANEIILYSMIVRLWDIFLKNRFYKNFEVYIHVYYNYKGFKWSEMEIECL